MPSTNKRINLTVPPETYERIQTYMKEAGVLSEAGACLQLIVMQLNSRDASKAFNNIFSNLSVEQLNAFSMEGNAIIKNEIEKNNNKK